MKLKPRKKYKLGDARVSTAFALVPVDTDDGKRVWLERVFVVSVLVWVLWDGSVKIDDRRWMPVGWYSDRDAAESEAELRSHKGGGR